LDAYFINIVPHVEVRNANICCITNHPPFSSVIKSRRLTFFGHLARMDENTGASQAIVKPLPENRELEMTTGAEEHF